MLADQNGRSVGHVGRATAQHGLARPGAVARRVLDAQRRRGQANRGVPARNELSVDAHGALFVATDRENLVDVEALGSRRCHCCFR